MVSELGVASRSLAQRDRACRVLLHRERVEP